VNVTKDGKSQTIKAQYSNSSIANFCCYSSTYGATGVSEPVRVGALPRPNGELSTSQAFRVYSIDGKSVNLTAGGGGAGGKTGLYAIPVEFDGDKPLKAVSAADGKTYAVYEVKDGYITIKGKQYPIKLIDGFYIIRKLTVRECMRLQTVPEWYEFPVSDTQAYKMLGNGWTVDVIAHLINAVKETL
jgi:DNA (cytosine-5)-methyltransferase 3A